MYKYRAKKVINEFGTFDSKREWLRFLQLRQMEEDGLISDLQRQVSFELVPEQREPSSVGKRGGVHKGKLLEKPIKYIADYVYTDYDGRVIVEDVKGVRTKDYIIKRKLMLWVHGIRVKEV